MLNIIKFPNEILKEQMPDFDFSNPLVDPLQLEKDMIDTMISNGGIGLSANQVGIRTRVFVMGRGQDARGFFNPFVEEAKNFTEQEEGCLSFPGIYAKIKRPSTITARWQNSKGEWEQSEFSGLTARCFLHEFDHLNGIVYQDRLSQLKWALAVKNSNKFKRKV
jgi:peptide deformylase